MDHTTLLNRVHPLLTNGNCLSAQSFEALFGTCSQQEQERLLAELTGLGVLVDANAAMPRSRKAISFCRSDFTSKQLWSLTNEQLCVLAQQGDERAKEILVRKTAGFVHLMARRVPQLLAHSCLTEEDNFQNGVLGLFTAIQRFDALQGYSFLTYAAYWIRQSILREAINTGLTVRIPVHYFDALCRVRVICATCMQLEGPALWRAIAEAETHSGHPCTVEQARRCLNDMNVILNVSSLNLMVGESRDTELAELLADDVSPDPADTVSENETIQEVRMLLSQLPERESIVLQLRYGIPDDRCRTLDEIGAQLGVTRERVRQIQMRAERRLRELLKRRSSCSFCAA